MKAFRHSVISAFGFANLYLLARTGPFVSPRHDLIFHFPGSAGVLFVAVLVELLLLWLVLTGVLLLARRRERLDLVVWCALILAIPWVLLKTYVSFSHMPVSPRLISAVGIFCLGIFLLLSLQSQKFLPFYRKAKPVLLSILGFTALSGSIILGELLWFGWQARDLAPPPLLHRRLATASESAHPRIIWILFDELSYQQIYERRFPGLELPAFDELASQSIVFTHAVPTAHYTNIAVPSLLTGIPLNDATSSANGRFVSMHDIDTQAWRRLQPRDTVFHDAIEAGIGTGIAGWYEPYCRILPGVLDRCFWTYRDAIPGGFSGDSSLGSNLLSSVHSSILHAGDIAGLGQGLSSDGLKDIRRHAADYRALFSAGDILLSDRSVGLLLLHMPIPHPSGFYDRKTRSFPGHRTSYIDNLALTDLYLAHVRQLLEDRHEWDSSYIIVMGDHSWRTSFIWGKSGFWTPEEEAASNGKTYDDRPAYIVKLPNQHEPERIDTSFEAVHTRALIDLMLQDRLHTAADLGRWVQQQTQPQYAPMLR